jgi:hypothetical protein
MVGWYNPPQLLRTGMLVTISTQFGLHADNRELQALRNPKKFHSSYEPDQPGHGEPLWIDFVADCGDGWNSTYTVAHAVGQERLQVVVPDQLADEVGLAGGLPNGQRGAPPDKPAKEIGLERGRLLIFGGDLVYPTPSGGRYYNRLIKPYRDALPEQPLDVWALPGNHDWYDSLVNFRRLFCNRNPPAEEGGRPDPTVALHGRWRLKQSLSYFAVQLRYGWWLFGIDVQLGHDIDHRQLEYFTSVLTDVARDDRIILCCAEPYWLHPKPVHKLLDTLIEQAGGA